MLYVQSDIMILLTGCRGTLMYTIQLTMYYRCMYIHVHRQVLFFTYHTRDYSTTSASSHFLWEGLVYVCGLLLPVPWPRPLFPWPLRRMKSSTSSVSLRGGMATPTALSTRGVTSCRNTSCQETVQHQPCSLTAMLHVADTIILSEVFLYT